MKKPKDLADNLDMPIFSFDKPIKTDSSKNMNLKVNQEEMQSKIEKIAVIGIGGAGNNAVQFLYENDDYINSQGQSVEHYVLNTDIGCLSTMSCPNKVILGPNMLNGKGAGANINVGREATLASKEEIDEICKGVDLVFLTAGMGGGTGTLGASVVAKAAHEQGAVVVSLVTIPFNYENRKRPAIYGIKALTQFSDSLIIIDNQKIVDCFPDAEFETGLNEANKILSNAIIGVIKVIRNPSKINTDFEDLKTILHNGGKSQILYNEVGADVLCKLKEDPTKTLDEVYRIVTNSPLVTKSDIKNATSFLILFECTHHFTQKHVDELVNRFSNPNNLNEGDDVDFYLDDLNSLDLTDDILSNQNLPQVIFAFNRIDADDQDNPRIIITVVATGMDSSSRDSQDKKDYINSYTSPTPSKEKVEALQLQAKQTPQAPKAQPHIQHQVQAQPQVQEQAQTQGLSQEQLQQLIGSLDPATLLKLLNNNNPQAQVAPQAAPQVAPQPAPQVAAQHAPQVAPQIEPQYSQPVHQAPQAPQAAPQAQYAPQYEAPAAQQFEPQAQPTRQPTSYNPPSAPQPSNAQPRAPKVFEAPKPAASQPEAPKAPERPMPVFDDDDIGIDE